MSLLEERWPHSTWRAAARSTDAMASEAPSSDDGGDFVSSSEDGDDDDEEEVEVSLNHRIQTAGPSLSLAGEGLQWVPDNLMRLAPLSLSGNLTVLDLSSNAIAEIPPSVSRLRALRNLNLAYNKLTRLPSTIGACVHPPNATSPRGAE